MNGSRQNNDFRANLAAGFFSGLLLGVGVGMSVDSVPFGAAVGGGLGVLLGLVISRREIPMRYRPNLVRRMLLTGSLFLLTMMLYAQVMEMPTDVNIYLLLSFPTLTGGLFVFSLGSAIASLDEMQRRFQTEAIAIGFAGTAIAVVPLALWNQQSDSPLQWVLLILVMVTSWAFGKFWVKRRYG